MSGPIELPASLARLADVLTPDQLSELAFALLDLDLMLGRLSHAHQAARRKLPSPLTDQARGEWHEHAGAAAGLGEARDLVMALADRLRTEAADR